VNQRRSHLWHLVLDRLSDVREAIEWRWEVAEVLKAEKGAQAEALIRQHIAQSQKKTKAVDVSIRAVPGNRQSLLFCVSGALTEVLPWLERVDILPLIKSGGKSIVGWATPARCPRRIPHPKRKLPR
jgi:hypothetical protein